MDEKKLRLDRDALSVVTLQEQEREEKTYWRKKKPHERLEALEITRQMIYGYDPSSTRLQRILEIVEKT